MAEGWCALFVRAPSPGQVLRFLERRFGRTPPERAALEAMGLLLSDAVGPEAHRVLLSPREALPWFEERLPAVATAFPPSAILLYAGETSDWGYRIHSEDGAESADRNAPPVSPLQRLLRAAPGSETAAVAWARERGLPADRLESRRRLPRVDYATVAGLDARGLLVENDPRFYTLSFTYDR